jgi:hypothetical protein
LVANQSLRSIAFSCKSAPYLHGVLEPQKIICPTNDSEDRKKQGLFEWRERVVGTSIVFNLGKTVAQ